MIKYIIYDIFIGNHDKNFSYEVLPTTFSVENKYDLKKMLFIR